MSPHIAGRHAWNQDFIFCIKSHVLIARKKGGVTSPRGIIYEVCQRDDHLKHPTFSQKSEQHSSLPTCDKNKHFWFAHIQLFGIVLIFIII